VVARHRRLPSRRVTATLVTIASSALVAGTVLVPAAPAGAATAPAQVGLFGAQDPTFDGAFRQSLGLLAYAAAGTAPPADAVSWLLAQQCADGGFEAFRANPTAACQKSDPATFSGEDTNSTGIAAAALRSIGRTAAADKALAWVLAAQNTDGGFPYFVGGDSDANSTAVVLLGTNTAGRTPASVQRGGVSAAHFLESLQIGCDGAATDDDGGFAFQDFGGPLVDSDAAAVQATLALSGAALPVAAGTVTTDVPRATCPSTASPTLTSAQLGAGHLARLLETFSGAVPQFDFNSGTRIPGSVSTGDTAWAALSLAAVGVGRDQLAQALTAIGTQPLKAAARSGAATAAAASATDQPGLLGLSAMAAKAAGSSSATVSGYVVRIGATMRVATAAVTPTATPSPSGASTSGGSTSGGSTSAATADGSDPLAASGPTSITPAAAVVGVLLVLLGGAALGTTRRRGAHA
jgi:hypothetical protein